MPHSTFRYSLDDIELGGVTIPAGAQVIICLASANRDTTRCPNGETLDISSAGTRHLAFGHGIHYCLGAGLARSEAQLALGSILARFPELRFAEPDGQLSWGHGDGLVLRGLTRLPVIPGPAVAPRPGFLDRELPHCIGGNRSDRRGPHAEHFRLCGREPARIGFPGAGRATPDGSTGRSTRSRAPPVTPPGEVRAEAPSVLGRSATTTGTGFRCPVTEPLQLRVVESAPVRREF